MKLIYRGIECNCLEKSMLDFGFRVKFRILYEYIICVNEYFIYISVLKFYFELKGYLFERKL